MECKHITASCLNWRSTAPQTRANAASCFFQDLSPYQDPPPQHVAVASTAQVYQRLYIVKSHLTTSEEEEAPEGFPPQERAPEPAVGTLRNPHRNVVECRGGAVGGLTAMQEIDSLVAQEDQPQEEYRCDPIRLWPPVLALLL